MQFESEGVDFRQDSTACDLWVIDSHVEPTYLNTGVQLLAKLSLHLQRKKREVRKNIDFQNEYIACKHIYGWWRAWTTAHETSVHCHN